MSYKAESAGRQLLAADSRGTGQISNGSTTIASSCRTSLPRRMPGEARRCRIFPPAGAQAPNGGKHSTTKRGSDSITVI